MGRLLKYKKTLTQILNETEDLKKGEYFEDSQEKCDDKCISLISNLIKIIDKPYSERFDIENGNKKQKICEIHEMENRAMYNLALYVVDNGLLKNAYKLFDKFSERYGVMKEGLLSENLFTVALKRIKKKDIILKIK